MKLIYKDFINNTINMIKKDFLENKETPIESFKKGDCDIVTSIDLAIEKSITNEIHKFYPDHLVIGEEFCQEKLTDEWTWIIDPIDGTLNFSTGNPLHGVQLSLYHKKTGVVTAIYLPATKELFYAEKGKGAYLNHNPININSKMDIKRSIISFGDFSHSNPDSRFIQLNLMDSLKDDVNKMRIYGSSAIDFAFVAAGRTQAHIMFSKRIWEMAAGILLIEEAGGITDKVGDAYIASNNSNLLNLIKSYL